jgi:Flp pilus assembly protein TadG
MTHFQYHLCRGQSRRWARRAKRRGVALPLFALLLVALLSMVAFSIDVGRVTVVRAEIQNAVDSAALAASLRLQQDPRAVQDAATRAREYVRRNHVGFTVTVPENSIAVEVGTWNADTRTFAAGGSEPNSVRVYATQDGESYSFSKVLGQRTFGAPASAIATSSSRPLDIMLVLDLSGSMAYQGRIQALQRAAPVFVDVIDGMGDDDQIGMMGLSADPSNIASSLRSLLYSSGLHASSDHHVGVLEARLTSNLPSLKTGALAVSRLTASRYNGWTGTGAALGDAAHYLSNNARNEAAKFIVLMSDGYANKPTDNGPAYARSMATYAAGLNITVHTISLGDEADVVLMQDIARLANGDHFDATGTGEAQLTQRLTDAFRDVAITIKRAQLVK